MLIKIYAILSRIRTVIRSLYLVLVLRISLQFILTLTHVIRHGVTVKRSCKGARNGTSAPPPRDNCSGGNCHWSASLGSILMDGICTCGIHPQGSWAAAVPPTGGLTHTNVPLSTCYRISLQWPCLSDQVFDPPMTFFSKIGEREITSVLECLWTDVLHNALWANAIFAIDLIHWFIFILKSVGVCQAELI